VRFSDFAISFDLSLSTNLKISKSQNLKIISFRQAVRGIMGRCRPAAYVDHFQVIPASQEFMGKNRIFI